MTNVIEVLSSNVMILPKVQNQDESYFPLYI